MSSDLVGWECEFDWLNLNYELICYDESDMVWILIMSMYALNM